MSGYRVDSKLYRCDYMGNRLEDISDIVIEGQANCNPANDQTWTFNATTDWDGYKRLEPYIDWVAPEQTVYWDNGVVETGQLGLYYVLESPATFTETSGRVKLRAMDPLYIVARQQLERKLEITENTQKDRIMRVLLEGMAFMEEPNGRNRFAIPSTNEKFKRPREFMRSENLLMILNEIAQGMGCYKLWTTPLGIVVTKKMGEARLKKRTPVLTYSAHLPEGYELSDHQLSINHPFSEIIDSVDTSPYDDSLINEAIMVVDDPGLPRIHVKARVRNPNNPRAALRQRRRKHRLRRHNRLLDNNITAQEVANAMLDHFSTKNRTAKITAAPRPSIDFAHETVDCHLWNAYGVPVANGQYAVHDVTYNFQPRQQHGTMVLNIGRIDDAEGALEFDDE